MLQNYALIHSKLKSSISILLFSLNYLSHLYKSISFYINYLIAIKHSIIRLVISIIVDSINYSITLLTLPILTFVLIFLYLYFF
jgi:hypothetical protein